MAAPRRPADRRSTLDDVLETTQLPAAVTCPFCKQDDTEQFAAFGGQVSSAQYYCRLCRTVFDLLRWRRG